MCTGIFERKENKYVVTLFILHRRESINARYSVEKENLFYDKLDKLNDNKG